MDKFQGKTKDNTDFDAWWQMVVEIYRGGFVDAPVFGGDPDYPYPWYTPTEEDVEKFVQNERVRALYKSLYDSGDDPHWAFAAMY